MTGSTTPCQDTIEAKAPCRCENCGLITLADELDPINDIGQRVAVGEIMPAGECPDCSALAHPVKPGFHQRCEKALRAILAAPPRSAERNRLCVQFEEELFPKSINIVIKEG